MSDNLWINLKILSKLPPYAKLNTQHELFYIEYNSFFSFTSIKRMIRGDNRSIAIKRIDKLVKDSIEALNDDSTIKEKCILELNPQNTEYLTVPNSIGNKDKGILLGDYGIKKEKDQPLRKEGIMETPLLEEDSQKQAF